MKERVKALSKSHFVRNVAVVATGTAGAQAVTMLFAPVITRLYGPEAFGLLGTFLAIVAIVTPVAALTYPIAIVLPRHDQDAKGLVRLSAWLAFFMALVTAMVLLVAGDVIARALNLESVEQYLLLVPIAMFFAALHQIMQQWLIRKKLFKVTAKVAVFQALTVNGTKAGIGWFHPLGAVLLVVATLGHGLHALLLWLGLRRERGRQKLEQTPQTQKERLSLLSLAQRHHDFPLYRAPQVTLNAVSQSLPVLMLASFFGPSAAGFYALGKTVMGIPTSLIGKSVGDVFYPRITEAAHNKENLHQLILKATKALALVGFLPFAVVIAAGPWLFAFVFGADWLMAGEYARWLALWMFFMFLNNPSVKALPVLGAQRFHLFFTTGTIMLRVAALAVGYYYFESDLIAVALFGGFSALINIALITIVLNKSRRFEHG